MADPDPGGRVASVHVLDESTLRRLVDMPSAIAAVREAFVALRSGAVDAPVRTALEGEAGSTLFMPGRIVGGALGLKVVSVRPANRERRLPTIHATILTVDAETGVPEALLDAGWLTALRTGAATGVATDLLALPEADTLAVIGAGGQAWCQVEAVAAVRSLAEVRIVSRSGDSARRLAARLVDEGVVSRARGGSDPASAVRGAGIVVTATDSATPVLADSDVGPGTHVNAVGGYRTDMQELPTALVGRALVLVDQTEAALAEAGDVTRALEAGVLAVGDLVELGAVAAGDHPGRGDPDEVTVFKSVGNVAQDLAVAGLALRRYRAR